MAWWTVILVVGALNYLSRLSFIAVFARVEMPPAIARALRFVPAAMLTAIVVPAVVFVGAGRPRVLVHQSEARRGALRGVRRLANEERDGDDGGRHDRAVDRAVAAAHARLTAPLRAASRRFG